VAVADDEPVSEVEQERLVEALRRHLADGRLDLGQFDARVARLYAATTRAGARLALDGLPPLPVSTGRAAGRKRHGEPLAFHDHWVATDEVFRDPSSGRVMRVWVDPTDGARHYLAIPT